MPLLVTGVGYIIIKMGCGGSKGGKGKVDLKIDETKIAEFDEVFMAIAEPLGTIADLKNGVNKAQANFEKACHCHGIKEHSLKDALWVMLTTCSAAVGGDFCEVDLKLTGQPPFIKIDLKKIDPSVHDVLNGFEAFVDACTAIGEKAEPLVAQITEAAEKCTDFPGKATQAVQDANLGLMDGAKAIKACGSNVAKLAKAPTILTEMIKAGKDAMAAFGDAVSMATSTEAMGKINEIGKKAHAAKHLSADKIICEYFPEQDRVDKAKYGKAGKK